MGDFGEVKIKSGRIDANLQTGWAGFVVFSGPFEQGEHFLDSADGGEAHGGFGGRFMVEGCAGRAHFFPAVTFDDKIGIGLAKCADEMGSVEIATDFGGGNKYFEWHRAG